MNQQICYVKIDVSCEASINFQHISQNATPATEFAPRHHLTQPWQCDSQKSRCKTRLKCCGCQAKWRWTRPKRCACHENWNPSFKNDAKLKVLRLPHKPTFDTIQNTSECHEVPRLLSETKQRDVWKSKSDPHCKTYHRHGHSDLARTNCCERLRTVAKGGERLRTVANVCERLRAVERTHPQPPDPQSETGALATHWGKKHAKLQNTIFTKTRYSNY